MRYREFLVEYRRDITAQNYGDKILRAFAEMPQQYLTGDVYDTMGVDPNTWSNLRTVAYLVKNPESYGDIDTNMRINGQVVEVNIKTAPEILRSNASLIINGILALLESKDPTPNKEYTQWITRIWCADPRLRFEDINRNDMLGIHYLAKRRRMLAPEHTDINRFRSYADFEITMDELYDADEIARGAQVTDKGTSELVYEDSDMRIIVPKDVAAACYYGQGTRWCTAATRGTNYFEQYNRRGPLYIILPKKPKHAGEKYQLHFEDGQLMNEEDASVPLTVLISRFPSLKGFIIDKVPDAKYLLELMSNERLVNYWRTGWEIVQSIIDEALTDYEMDDDDWHDYRVRGAEKRGYIDSDGEIDWDRVNNDSELGDYNEYNPEYSDIIRGVKEMSKLSPLSIREVIFDFMDGPGLELDGLLTVGILDEIYAYVIDENFSNIADRVSNIIRYDLIITTKATFGTNRTILQKKETDGYVFALAKSDRRRR